MTKKKTKIETDTDLVNLVLGIEEPNRALEEESESEVEGLEQQLEDLKERFREDKKSLEGRLSMARRKHQLVAMANQSLVMEADDGREEEDGIWD